MEDAPRARCAGGLPAELTRFVGRDAEVAEVKEMLSGAGRLVSLVGVGGVGKTRVGLRVASDVGERFPDGVHFVELSGLRDPELLPNAISAAVDLPELSDARDRSLLDVLVSYFADRRFLIVLDTCEHLVDACASFCEAVLRRCPGVRILATTRQPLDVPGERLLQIMPLYAPDPDDTEAFAGMPDAMVLFAERAAAVMRGFQLTEANRGVVAALCHRLDGIPLAIELAVVRLRALPLDRLLVLLDDRFRLLTGGSRAPLPRHQTLRTAVDWSFGLCSAQEQLLWARLSVFPGEFGLSAVEEVCSGGSLPADQVLESLIGLVDKAIVQRADTNGRGSTDLTIGAGSEPDSARYRMLDTIRQYGSGLLADAGDEDEIRARHRDHYLAVARDFAPRWLSDDEAPWLRQMRRDLPSLRGALEFCCASGTAGAGTGLEMATALWGLWLGLGRLVEGCYWLERLLSLYPAADPIRMHALNAAADLTLLSGRHERGSELLEEAAVLARAYDDPSALAYVAKNRVLKCTVTGDFDPIADLTAHARTRFAALGDRGGEAWTLTHMSGCAVVVGKYEEALVLCEETRTVLGAPAERWVQGWIGWEAGVALWGLQRYAEAEASLRSALTMCWEINHAQALAYTFDALGWNAAAEGQFERGARLLGIAVKLWEKFDEPRAGVVSMHRAHESAVALTRDALGPARFQALLDEGAVLPLHRAVALAVEPYSPMAAAVKDGKAGPWEVLTAREQQIAALVAEELSNRQIAERLVISKRTVDSHLEHISRKLGYSSRNKIAGLAEAHAPGTGPDPTA